MYRTCAVTGCDRHVDVCHVHHLAEWDELGETNLDNLLPCVRFIIIGPMRADGDCNSTRAPANSPSDAPTTPSTHAPDPTSSTNEADETAMLRDDRSRRSAEGRHRRFGAL